MTTSLHAHVFTESCDCDGPKGYDYIVTLNSDEFAEHVRQNGVNDFHAYRFKERVLGGIVSFSSKARIEVDELGFTYSEATEEGYRNVEARWCNNAYCDPSVTSQRDRFAEAAGY